MRTIRHHHHPLLFLLVVVLAAAPVARGPANEEAVTTFFLGRLKYSDNDGDDCPRVSTELMMLVSEASTIEVRKERKLRLTDPRLFDTPFLFVNGHKNFVLTEAELETLRKYFSHGGFMLASGCCTNPAFPTAVRRELGRLFRGASVKVLPYEHQIYRSFHQIERVRCLHEPRDIHLEGLYHGENLVAVLCEDGLCCAFSMENRCNSGKGVSTADGRKLALNIAIYALTH